MTRRLRRPAERQRERPGLQHLPGRLGGSASDEAGGIAVDASGYAYVFGHTASTNFPLASVFQPTFAGDYDAFVAKLAPDGSALVYSTYLGGSHTERNVEIGITPAGAATVVGTTWSSNFPTYNALDPTIGGVPDAFVTRLNASGSALVFSTYFGGNGLDEGFGVAVDSGGYTALAGKTHSTDLPVVNAAQSVCTPPLPCYDAFVARINPTGSAWVFSTYLGGSAGDEAQGIAADVDGGVYVTGRTWSTDFPTQNPMQPSFRGGNSDAFVVVYAPDGARGFGTYFGGTARDDGLAIAVDGDRSIYFAGSTSSTNFPTVLPVQAVYGGGDIDAYAVRLFPGGSSVAYSTFLGGNLSDTALAIDLLGDSDAYLAGGTRSTNFPLVSPYQAALRGSSEVFISRITDTTPPHEESRSITYTYDPLYRLTAADYDDGTYFHYTYDAVGNRITETTVAGSTVYAYDDANRMTSVGGVAYSWSDNGNLLSDGTYSFTYDHANRLTSATWGTLAYGFAYDGLGDRLRQTVAGAPTNYTLDLAGGLTQVLSDGTNAYLYGVNRIGEDQPGGWQYHLGDALGSVRQLADATVNINLARSYEPFGDPVFTTGSGTSIYAFAGEQRDATGLTYLRARYYASYLNQWIQPDPIVPDPFTPADLNRYAYVRNNPVNFTDPAGLCVRGDAACLDAALDLYHRFNWRVFWSGYGDAWTAEELRAIQDAGQAIAGWLDAHGGNGEGRIRAEFAPATFHHTAGFGWILMDVHHVQWDDLYMLSGFTSGDVVHEMGHILDNLHSPHLLGSIIGGGPSDAMVREMGIDPTLCQWRFDCSRSRYRWRNYQEVWEEAQKRNLDVEEPPWGSYGGNYARILGPSEDFAATFEMIVTRTLGGNTRRRAAWFSNYARSLTRSAARLEGDPYTCWALPIPSPIPTP